MASFAFTGRSDTTNYGEQTFGDDPFGQAVVNDANYEAVVASFPRVFDTSHNSVLDKYAEIVGRLATAQDRDLDRLYNQRFVVSARGRALERYGEPFNVRRRTDESDASLRTRIGTQRRVAASETTYDDIATIVTDLLDTKSVTIDSAEQTGGGTVRVTVPSDAIADAPLTRQQLESQIDDGVPPTHSVDLVTDDTLVLGATGSQGLGEGSLT